jgi:hypothetical protein
MKFKSGCGLTALMGYLTQGVLAALVLLAFLLVGNPVLADLSGKFCTKTSLNMLESCKFGAEDDYGLAIAKCNNLPTHAERHTCKRQAWKDMKSGKEECRDQFDARQKICKVLGQDVYNPIINPADFVATINNTYFPLTPGTTYIYEGTTEKGNEHNEVYVTSNTKVILDVTCVEVRDTVTVDGNLVEDTLDWYAQDTAGNVWYFGENAVEYEDGLVVGLGGSWIAGVDGAKPGIIMEASPNVDDLYRQEFALGEAEDMAQVLSLSESVTVSYGSFTNCLETKEFSPLEPDAVENKFYAQGIGNIQTVDVVNGYHTDLISITP